MAEMALPFRTVSEIPMMPRLSAPAITLSESEQDELESLAKRPSTPQQIALRANIILRAAQGDSHRAIAQAFGVSKAMSRRWQRRWLALSPREIPVSERLQDAYRSGTPPTFSLEPITVLYALACAPPEQYGRPLSHWTPRELADEMVKQRIVESISERHVGRLLTEAELKPHQSRYWLHPPQTPTSKPKLKTSATSTNKRQPALNAAS